MAVTLWLRNDSWRGRRGSDLSHGEEGPGAVLESGSVEKKNFRYATKSLGLVILRRDWSKAFERVRQPECIV